MSPLVKGSRIWSAFLVLIIFLFPLSALAKEVGQFTQVEGKVDLRKKGKAEAIPAQPKTGAEEKDAIKTEAMSRAQIQFLDASTMTVAPLSVVTIESYMFDPQKGECGSLSELTKGLVHLVVSPLAKLRSKEFLVKTPTATMGIRGTELYILIGPDFTDVFVKEGSVSAEANPAKQEKSDLGPGNDRYGETLWKQVEVRGVGGRRVLVNAMFGLRIPGPMTPVRLTDAHFRTLSGLMYSGLPPNLGRTSDPAQLLDQISRLTPLGYTPPAPPAPPADVGPTFPGGGVGGGGGGVASPSS